MPMSAASHRTSEASHSLDGTKTIGQLNRELQEVHDGQPATARCAWCSWTFEGTAVEARDAFAFHRSSAHPDKVNGATARELLEKMDRGESVAAVGPIPAGTCKREGCTEPPKATRGRYALLCEAHIEERKVALRSGASVFPPSTEEPKPEPVDPPPGCREAGAQAAPPAEGAGREATREAEEGCWACRDHRAGRGWLFCRAVRARGGATRHRRGRVPAGRRRHPDPRGAR